MSTQTPISTKSSSDEVNYMHYLCSISAIIAAIGAINWLLVAQFDFNLVDTIAGKGKIVYILVGIFGIVTICCQIKWMMKPGFGKKRN